MKSSFITKLRNYFLAGIVTLIPIFITVYLTIVVIDLFSKIVPDALNPNKYLPFQIPGLEILIALFITTSNRCCFFNLFWQTIFITR